jgi:putative membrane protein
MMVIANVLVALVAVLHLYFLVLEMFLWTKPLGLKTFNQTQQKADDSAVLAVGFEIKLFFLLCVIVAGLYGGYSVNTRIILVQAVPAALALALLLIA